MKTPVFRFLKLVFKLGRTSCWLMRQQVRLSGGIWPAVRYAAKRIRSLGIRKSFHLVLDYSRSSTGIVETPIDLAAGGQAVASEGGWSGYALLSDKLSTPRPSPICSPVKLAEVPEERFNEVLERFNFPEYHKPIVSIIIPFHNQVKYSVECLLSLSETDDASTPYEILLADDASSENSVTGLMNVRHVRYLRNPSNLGFLHTCNRAASEAKGQYLVFLNNDTQVTPGWLSALLEVFKECPDAGAVGPKVLYPSGHLQEAGGLLRGDMTTEMVGVNDNPDHPCFNIRRAVDYCSGVCLMVEREVFLSVGGFSDEFAPAYYEDVDLCLKLRTTGRRIYYQPKSVVVHHLSKSHATPGNTLKNKLICRNRQKMVEKWQAFVDHSARTRQIAFYLPQYHPIPENDRWWGKGFTEWRNVAAATPVFDGHVQPRLPGDLGFYDLRVPEVMEQQAELAQRYGITGFCYYYYWFGGKRLLEMPLERMLDTGKPDFPFCLCWANENWTRRWDGQDKEVLLEQSHSPDDDEAIIRDLIRYLHDPRYIRINGRPLLLVYRTSLLPDMRKTGERWRQACRREGLGEIYLAGVESLGVNLEGDPDADGIDFTVAFPPHGTPYPNRSKTLKLRREALVYNYLDMIQHFVNRKDFSPKRFLSVCPGWDNTPRRKTGSTIFTGSTPGYFQAWLEWTIDQTRRFHQNDERLVFINAWNEWAEGAVLEPDSLNGHDYLEAVRNAIHNSTVR
ncbi:MAG: glycosyltransferase [Lentisphaerae bacterium]|nr:glycosyltransferase [Lentisphaerota bacterium]